LCLFHLVFGCCVPGLCFHTRLFFSTLPGTCSSPLFVLGMKSSLLGPKRYTLPFSTSKMAPPPSLFCFFFLALFFHALPLFGDGDPWVTFSFCWPAPFFFHYIWILSSCGLGIRGPPPPFSPPGRLSAEPRHPPPRISSFYFLTLIPFPLCFFKGQIFVLLPPFAECRVSLLPS